MTAILRITSSNWSVLLLFVLLLFTSGYTQQKDSYPKLKLVQIAYRHGARGPLATYPTDPNRMHPWPQGEGQLLPIGMENSFKLGEFIKRRYEGLVSDEYVIDELYVRSSDVDRTIMSAECVLTGMYPTTPEQSWNPDYRWQPTSQHTVPVGEDRVLRTVGLDCGKIDALQEETVRDPDYQARNASYTALYEYLNSHGHTHKTTPTGLFGYQDATKSAEALNLTVPDWITDEVMHALSNDIAQLKYTESFGGKEGLEKRRLLAGPFVTMLLGHIRKTLNSTETSKKMVHYSTHDDDLALMLMTMTREDAGVSAVEFNAAIFWELYETSRENYSVRIFYKNGIHSDLTILPVVGCSNTTWCPLEEFEHLMSYNIITDSQWEEECSVEELEQGTGSGSGSISYGFILIVCILLILILLVITLAVYAVSVRTELKRLKLKDQLERQPSVTNGRYLIPRQGSLAEIKPLIADRASVYTN